MRQLLPVLWTVLGGSACNSESPVEPVATDVQAPSVAVESSDEGWGAVFWKDDVAWKVGGGLDTIGPRGRATATLRDSAAGHCGGQAIDGAAPKAVVAAPAGSSGETPTKPAVIAASVVEAAAWRLDEVLPGRDRFTPVDPQAAPAVQRGVQVGSVVKVRRYGGPPVLVVGGSRAGVGALLVLDREATAVLAQLELGGMATTPRVLPPTDLDGDGHLETALFTGESTLLARLELTPATVSLRALESWHCTPPPAEN